MKGSARSWEDVPGTSILGAGEAAANSGTILPVGVGAPGVEAGTRGFLGGCPHEERWRRRGLGIHRVPQYGGSSGGGEVRCKGYGPPMALPVMGWKPSSPQRSPLLSLAYQHLPCPLFCPFHTQGLEGTCSDPL